MSMKTQTSQGYLKNVTVSAKYLVMYLPAVGALYTVCVETKHKHPAVLRNISFLLRAKEGVRLNSRPT